MHSRWHKPALFLLCSIPFCVLVYNGFTNNLTANPIKEITHFTGGWALKFLLITLSITPLRKITRNNSLIRFRRMLGLFAFFYACLHFSTYLVLDQFFDWDEIVRDVAKRPYITVGFTAFVLLIPLAVTSTNKMVQRLGNNWRRLHKLIYPIAILVEEVRILVRASSPTVELLGFRQGREVRAVTIVQRLTSTSVYA